jgi:hypothetical protein
MITQTMAQMIASVELLGDLEGLIEVNGRHEPADVKKLLCVSERSLRTMTSSWGYSDFVESTASASLPVSATVAGWRFATVDWPEDSTSVSADKIVAFHVDTGGGWRQIDEVSWQQRRIYEGGCEGLVWCRQRRPGTSLADNTQQLDGKIILMPLPTGGSYSIDFLPSFPELDADGDIIVSPAEWHRWRVLDTVVTLLGVRDGDDGGRAQWAAGERKLSEDRIKADAPRAKQTPKATPRRRPRGM